MKVTQSSQDCLVLEDVPWIRGILVILTTLYVTFMGFSEHNAGRSLGLPIVAFGLVGGLVFFSIFIQRYQIIFDRTHATLIKRKRSMFGFQETRHDLSHLSHAELEERTDSDGGKLYAPVLIMMDGPDAPRLRLVDYQTTGWGPPVMVAAINEWLGIPEQAKD